MLYPYARKFEESLLHQEDGGAFTALHSCWERSRQTLALCRELLSDRAGGLTGLRCVAVSGSLGRMEQTDSSDLDLLIVTDNELEDHPEACQELWSSVWRALSPVGIRLPKPKGLYGGTTSERVLCAPQDRGIVAEDMIRFGRRIQLMLDCQPLWGDSEFDRLLVAVFHRYTCEYAQLSESPWDALSTDLIRYYRSIEVSCRWENRDEPEVWRERNLKLRFSRRLNVMGLQVLLATCPKDSSEPERWVSQMCRHSALERLVLLAGDDPAERQILLGPYDQFLAAFSDSAWRERLVASNSKLDENLEFRTLLYESRLFGEAISTLILRRGLDWGRSVVDRLLVSF